MAARLSEDPAVSVCLVEAGGQGTGLPIRIPMGTSITVPGLPKIANWAYRTVPQPGLNGRRGYQPRGKALGGSSAINGMLYVRGHPFDYDDWAADGCTGWDWNSVLPYFKKAEQNNQFDDELHGGNGPLHVSQALTDNPLNAMFYSAAQARQIRYNPDFNGPEQEGVGPYQVTQFRRGERHGERCSAAAAYLHPNLERPNLDVITRAHISKIVIENGRATGAEYIKGGQTHHLTCQKEVILSAGAFGSPQILLLSGIGPKQEVEKHGIAHLHELPGVGQNLQDHLDFTLSWRAHAPYLYGVSPAGLLALARATLTWLRTGEGPAASTLAEAGAFLKSSPELDRPDLQIHLMCAVVEDHGRKRLPYRGYSAHVCVLRPQSRGTVTLASANPKAAPLIDPQFLSDPADLDLLLKGTKQMREIMQSSEFDSLNPKQRHLKGDEDDETLIAHIRKRADTIYHPVGTCKMGTDPMAVVGPDAQVHGLNGLRVVDASIMPTLIGGNTNAPTIMMAEKIAEQMRHTKTA